MSGVFRFSCILLCILAASPALAGDITLTPTRVVFHRMDRSQEVALVNTSNSEEVYRISLINLRQLPNGKYEEITDATNAPDHKFAGSMIRYSPRQVVLPPGSKQTVRLLLRRPKNLPQGEYRSHLLFTSAPSDMKDMNLGEEAAKRNVRVGLRMVYKISIPVIVREGSLFSDASVTGLALERDESDKPKFAVFNLNRAGSKSLYGEATVYFIPADRKKKEKVGYVSNLKVYPPGKSVEWKVPLTFDKLTDWRKGKFLVEYTDLDTMGLTASAMLEAE